MFNEKDLLEKRARVFEEMKNIGATAKAEKRELTEEETLKFNKADEDFKSLTEKIERSRAMAKNAKIIELQGDAGEGTPKNLSKEERAKRYEKTFDKFLRGSHLSNEERGYLKRGTNTQITTTDSLGGYLVPEGFERTLIETMSDYSGVIDAAFIYNTTTGNPIPVPTVNDTATDATLVGEGVASTVQDVTLGSITLNAYTYRTLSKASEEFLQDSAMSANELFNFLFAKRFGRGVNTHLTTGDGSSKPNGIVTASTLGTTAAATNAVTRDEILDLLHSVDRAYRRSSSCGFMLNDGILKVIKKLAIGSSDDRPLWQPSVREGEPDTLEGFQYWTNADMASSLTASAKPILFGDMSKYWVRIVNQMTIRQLNERYADELSTGFLGFMRVDGDLMDTAAVKHLITAAS